MSATQSIRTKQRENSTMSIAQIDVAELPALATKKQTAQWANTSTRNVELQVAAGRFPQPIRIGQAPRWRRSDLLAWLDSQNPKIKTADKR
jgi:hypothetical protein